MRPASQGELFRVEATWFHLFHSMFRSGDVARMGAYAFTVYAAIKAHANFKTGESWPSLDTIVAETSISRSQVIRVLESLEALGYINRKRNGKRNEYRLREKVSLLDDEDFPAATATWDYLPTAVQAAIVELKNVAFSGDFSESRVVHIERLQVNVTHASGNAVVLNAQDISTLPPEIRDALQSIKANMDRRNGREEL